VVMTITMILAIIGAAAIAIECIRLIDRLEH
jgi:hypothetical protein